MELLLDLNKLYEEMEQTPKLVNSTVGIQENDHHDLRADFF